MSLSKVRPIPPTEPLKRILCFDLENRPSAYWYDGQTTSQITAFGWKWSDEPGVHSMCLRNDGYFEGDEEIRIPYGMAHVIFCDLLHQADLVYGHNIRKHDLPMFQSHLMRLELPTLKPLLTSDTLRDIPKRNGMSASLDNLSALYGLGTKQGMSQADWEKANQLQDSGIALARSRVVSDVLLQEKLRKKLIELHLLKDPKWWRP